MDVAQYYLDGNADAVEFCPHYPSHHILAAATYTLQEGVQSNRSGSISLFSIGIDTGLKLLYHVETAGVFDIKWNPDGANMDPLLAQADADGYLRLHGLGCSPEVSEGKVFGSGSSPYCSYSSQLTLKKPSHPTRGVSTAVSSLATLLKEPLVRSSFVQADGVKLLVPLISPASTQQSMQILYETCLCIWLLSYYEPAVEYLATTRTLPRLIEVVKGSTKEKVVRVIVLTFRNLLPKGTVGAQMVDLGLPIIVQSLKAQAWSDEDLLDALKQLEEGLKDNIKNLSSFDKYKQEVLLGHLDWSPVHKDPVFWRENITSFEENDFQILRVLITILDTSHDSRALAVACYDLSQFVQYYPAGRGIVNDLKAKERVMKLMNHENAEVTKNALLCIQRLFLGAKYASFLQV